MDRVTSSDMLELHCEANANILSWIPSTEVDYPSLILPEEVLLKFEYQSREVRPSEFYSCSNIPIPLRNSIRGSITMSVELTPVLFASNSFSATKRGSCYGRIVEEIGQRHRLATS